MGNKKILIIDDDKEFCEMLEDILQLKGYDVQKAFNGKEALKIMENEKFDLVITDKNMPELCGIEVITGIKKQFPKIPVIITTAFGDKKFKEESLKAGAFEYFSKPLKISNLIDAINRATGR
ncbi:MAG: response regulator [Candidatus Schekmanbacteria bacterium]|nr:MAG: response regulator [Candidatus Schekmanbacteria bacterium]